MLARLRHFGVTHLLVREDFPSGAIQAFRQRSFWWDRLVPIRSWDEVRLYRLTESSDRGSPRIGRNFSRKDLEVAAWPPDS